MASGIQAESEMLVEPIRSASRHLVRELGFMSSTLAGTTYPPSAVHALIEIGAAETMTMNELREKLNLDQDGMKHTLKCILDAKEIEVIDHISEGEELLALTPKGQISLVNVNDFARDQVLKALARLNNREAESVLLGLQTYVTCLNAQRTAQPKQSVSNIEIVRGYEPGLIGRALEMHLAFYSKMVGFGSYFERQLATDLADLVSRIESDENEAWTARMNGRIVGTIFIDGEDIGQNRAHLRAFIVDNDIRGGGIGRRLLAAAMDFVDQRGFEETHLWTFQGLDAARRLYESFGFLLKEQYRGNQWGGEVIEQLFIRKLKCGKS